MERGRQAPRRRAQRARSSSAATTSRTGYENNPKANGKPSPNGWFHTGDQGIARRGRLHLRITGRLKEIINRGGEKVSPREVDEVLMDHPAVAAGRHVRHAARQARRGSGRGGRAARGQQAASERELQDFAATGGSRTSRCRAKFVMLAEIPKGATGKLQRIGLAEKLGLAAGS